MKRTQYIDLVTTIRDTGVTFFSIMMFVALAVAIFLGIDWSGKALRAAAENTYNETSFHDATILFPYGLSDSDIEELSKLEGVSEVERGQTAFETMRHNDSDYSVRLSSLNAKIDKPVLIDGELPHAEDEIAVDARWAWRYKANVGDTMELVGEDSENRPTKQTRFTITATIENPEFLSNSANTWGAASTATGAIELLAWIPLVGFDAEYYYDGYTQVALRADALRAWPTYDESYTNASKELVERVKSLGQERSDLRHQEFVATAQGKVDDADRQMADARAELDNAEVELADADAKIADAERQLADGEQQLADKKKEYEQAKKDGKAQLEDGLKQINDGQKTYDDALAQFNSKIAEYNNAVVELRAQEAELDPALPGYADAIKVVDAKWDKIAEAGESLESARAELDSKRVELESARQTYQDGLDTYNQQVADGAQAIKDGEAELEKGRKELEDGKAELAKSKAEFEDAKKEFADKSRELEQAREDVRTLEEKTYGWTVLSRAENGGFISVSSFVDIANRLRTSMASLFVLVGLFVCYAAIARLVREQVRQIGTKKALGMRAGEVTASFLLYTNYAVVQGLVIGVLAAIFVVERIIIPVLSASFFMHVPAWWSLSYALIFGLVELALITLSTWLACHSVLSRHAVELLAGTAPPNNKERFFESWAVWKSLPLYTQTTINNLLNDKRRVMSTLVGVAGCTALVVCAITLNDDVIAGVGKQYTDVYHYDALVRANLEESGSLEKSAEKLTELGCLDSTVVATRMVSLSLPDGTTSAATITVPQDSEDFEQLVTLTSIAGDTAGKQVRADGDGVWVSSAYADHYGGKPGDKLKVTLGDGSSYELPIAGFFRHYLVGHQIIMSPTTYHQIFNVEPTFSKLLVRTGDKVTADELKEKLEDVSYVSAVANDREDQETLFNSFRKVSRVVVLVYLALSIAMAIVVLLNLNVMFVEEKRRDLITLMVCGYTVRDAKGYIWHDNLALTILGILLGTALGMAAGYFAVVSMEISTVTLVKSPVVRACLAGAAASAMLSTIMTLLSLTRIPKLKLADINRL